MTKKLLTLAFLPLLLAGCVTRVTNLTATTQPRNPTGLYRLEYQWRTNQRTIIADSIQPYVMVGFDSYQMQKTRRMTNRWEVLVPVPADQDVLRYSFKVDYEYMQFGEKRGKGSKSSQLYKLYIK